MNTAAILGRAFALLQQGQMAQAEAVLAPVMPASGGAGLHLLGLIRSAQGRWPEAHDLLTQSLQRESSNFECWTNLGNLSRQMDAVGPAERHYRHALALSPKFVPALRGLSRLLLDEGSFEHAETSARSLLIVSGDALAGTYLAQALRGQRRFREALEACENAISRGARSPAILLERGINLEKLGQIDAAISAYQELETHGVRDPALYINWGSAEAAQGNDAAAIAQLRRGLVHAPRDPQLYATLTQALAAMANADPEREVLEALAQEPGHAGLLRAAATLLRQLDRPHLAPPLFVAAKQAAPKDAWIDLAWAEHLDEAGDPQAAMAILKPIVPIIAPTRHSLSVLAHAYLRTGSASDALRCAEQILNLSPYDQLGLAYSWTAERLLGRGQGSKELVRTYELQPPAGYASLEAFHAALQRSLDALHDAAAVPLGQSVRRGTQTSKSLLESSDPVILGFLEALNAPLQQYEDEMAGMGCNALRNRRTGRRRLRGCWSIRLRAGGWHVNHFHPQGWISSAYYVRTPEAPGHEGWLKFGEPRFPIPGCDPDHWIAPKPGRLVLFPSFLWHGVEGFSSGGDRLTIAFDVVPA